jgi:2-methylcitrate dehydratase
MATATKTFVTLPRNTNQAKGLGQYAVDFMSNSIGEPDESVRQRTRLFFTDAVLVGLSSLSLGTNAPQILRSEALSYLDDQGATVFGSPTRVRPEKAIVANCAAVREWDSNGTVFGYNAELGNTAGEFGHNDFYGVPIAAAQVMGFDGDAALRGMICLDEIRGRLAEVFSLKTYKIDHVVHGAIASAAVYGAMCGATAEQIESAIGMVVAHFIPWRAIRAGKQLSDSKGASAAISAEVAVLSMIRSMKGFLGPADIFRNPEAIWRQFEPTDGDSPFELVLGVSGNDFAVMGMHFKIGLYEHQSAGALHGLIMLIHEHPELCEALDQIERIDITAYEPAYGIIGDPAKRDPKTRQSADHSMVYIVSTILRKAMDLAAQDGLPETIDEIWQALMLGPYDYSEEAIFNERTRMLMDRIHFNHGGKEYDDRYPDGIPTSMVISLQGGTSFDSGLVMYPAGHARNTTSDLNTLLDTKFDRHGHLAVAEPTDLIQKCRSIDELTSAQLLDLFNFTLLERTDFH